MDHTGCQDTPSTLCSLKPASLQSFIAICHATATVLMSMVLHHSSQTTPGDMRSPTRTSQPRGWPPFNRDALACFMTKMPMPKRQPGLSQPQPCRSKFTERLEGHPCGQSGRARQEPRQGCPQMLVAKTPFVILSPQMAPGKRFPAANLS